MTELSKAEHLKGKAYADNTLELNVGVPHKFFSEGWAAHI
jgi:hypothetical protein